ncbi:MAG: hypothetical protein JWN62_4606 [Acidimicrobiales bacterium]|nr:hypothetical protein [Acidimicrobiales bacterium]
MSDTIPYPAPLPDALTQGFWDAIAARRLAIQRCRECGKFVHTPKASCPFCLSLDLFYDEVSGQATLYTYAIAVHQYHPALAHRGEYVIALVELPEQDGLRFLSNVVDCPEDELEIGMPLELVFEEITPGMLLPMFRRPLGGAHA